MKEPHTPGVRTGVHRIFWKFFLLGAVQPRQSERVVVVVMVVVVMVVWSAAETHTQKKRRAR